MVIKTNWSTKGLLMIIVVVSIFMINIGRPQALHNGYVNYYGIEMTDNEYFTLVNLGFTDDEIHYMTEETFEENKDLNATLVATTHKYFKIINPMYGSSYVTEATEQEYLQHTMGQVNEPLGEVMTYWIHEVSTISENGSKYRYKNSVSWYNIPDEKYYDVTGIGFINSVYIDSSVYFNYTYANSSGNYTTSTMYYDKKSTSTGGTTVYKIPSNIVMLSSAIFFDVSKNTTDTLTGLQFCGDYAHALYQVSASQAANHGVNSGGIIFDPSVYNNYNQIPCAYASVSVNW